MIIETNAFCGLSNLIQLNLSNNLIRKVDINILSGMVKLKYFSILNNERDVLKAMTLQVPWVLDLVESKHM